jgi:hypothetical protein
MRLSERKYFVSAIEISRVAPSVQVLKALSCKERHSKKDVYYIKMVD